MMDQVTYLAWAIGQPQYYRACYFGICLRRPLRDEKSVPSR